MDNLNDHERRLTLGALWSYRTSVTRDLTEGGDDAAHIAEVTETLDSAARKLGGDSDAHMYGAPNF